MGESSRTLFNSPILWSRSTRHDTSSTPSVLPIADGASDDLVMLDLDHVVGPITWILERSDDVARGTPPVALDIGG